MHEVPAGTKPIFVKLINEEGLTVGQLARIEAAIEWAAQHGYAYAEDAAAALGRLTGREMVNDQPYYNSYRWITQRALPKEEAA